MITDEKRLLYNYRQRERDKINIVYLRKQCKEYYWKNRKKYIAQCKEYVRKNPLDPIKREMMYRNPKSRYSDLKSDAKRKGYFNINFDQYTKLINNVCHYCKKTLKEEKGHSLDRIDNSKGYTLDNVLPCCGFCNKLRGNLLTVKEAEILIKPLVKLRKK